MFGIDEKNFNEIKSTAQQYQIPIIEDCTQALEAGAISVSRLVRLVRSVASF